MLVLGEPTRMAACISRDQIEKAPLESAHHSPVGRMTGDSDSPAAPWIIAHGLAESGMGGVLHSGRIGPDPT
jgi:hypothetical protein